MKNFPKQYRVACHSDNVMSGGTFVAIKGFSCDGGRYVADAIERGASVVIADRRCEGLEELEKLVEDRGAVLEIVDNARRELAIRSAKEYQFPATKMRFVAVTGTKGKTTTAVVIETILREAGYRTALISSVYNRILDDRYRSLLTTEQPDYLNVFFDICQSCAVQFVVMEVAAHAISLDRIYGLEFDSVVITNLAHEHLEFYENLQDYWVTKLRLFEQVREGGSKIVNGDDPALTRLVEKGCHAVTAFTLAGKHDSEFKFEVVNEGFPVQIRLADDGDKQLCIESERLAGRYNAYNLAAASTVALKLGVLKKTIRSALLGLEEIPGRLNKIEMPNGSVFVIDYAHNPSSLKALLDVLRPQTSDLIVVFGAGGGRDKQKRPIMGKVASEIGDRVILTSDNPRFEEPGAIIADIAVGVDETNSDKLLALEDRGLAIQKAYELSEAGSIIAVLGKGAEVYEEIRGQRRHYNDAEIIATIVSS